MVLCGHFVALEHTLLKDVLTAPFKHNLAQTSHTSNFGVKIISNFLKMVELEKDKVKNVQT